MFKSCSAFLRILMSFASISADYFMKCLTLYDIFCGNILSITPLQRYMIN